MGNLLWKSGTFPGRGRIRKTDKRGVEGAAPYKCNRDDPELLPKGLSITNHVSIPSGTQWPIDNCPAVHELPVGASRQKYSISYKVTIPSGQGK